MRKTKELGTKSLSEYGDLLSIKDASEVLGLCERVVRSHCADGTIPALKIGARWYIPKARFAELFAA